MKNNRETLIVFIDAWLILGLIILANYFQTAVVNLLPWFPAPIIPLLSLFLASGMIFFFWRRENESERLKQEFIAVVTHKFRTPVAGMKWAIQTLSEDPTFQRNRDLFNDILRANQRVIEIVDLLTGFATFQEQYAYELVSLRTLVDISLEKHAQLIRDRQITFNIESSADRPLIYLDRAKIQFVLDILLENALKYSPKGGRVTIQMARNKNQVILGLSDNGIGISPADRSRVFKRFWRSAEAKTIDTEGMGLGLYTARSIVLHHGGKMWVESPGLGKGATFYLQLKAGSL